VRQSLDKWFLSCSSLKVFSYFLEEGIGAPGGLFLPGGALDDGHFGALVGVGSRGGARSRGGVGSQGGVGSRDGAGAELVASGLVDEGIDRSLELLLESDDDPANKSEDHGDREPDDGLPHVRSFLQRPKTKVLIQLVWSGETCFYTLYFFFTT